MNLRAWNLEKDRFFIVINLSKQQSQFAQTYQMKSAPPPRKVEISHFNSFFLEYSGKADSIEFILEYLTRRLDTAPNGWTTRSILFCNAGSIRDSAMNMAEVAVSALNEVGRSQSYDVYNVSFFGAVFITHRKKSNHNHAIVPHVSSISIDICMYRSSAGYS